MDEAKQDYQEKETFIKRFILEVGVLYNMYEKLSLDGLIQIRISSQDTVVQIQMRCSAHQIKIQLY